MPGGKGTIPNPVRKTGSIWYYERLKNTKKNRIVNILEADNMILEKQWVDWLFKDQARVGEELNRISRDEWYQIYRWLRSHTPEGATPSRNASPLDAGVPESGAMEEEKKKGNKQRFFRNGRREEEERKEAAISDIRGKLAALDKLEKDGFGHPERLPMYYEESGRKSRAFFNALHATGVHCPGCGSTRNKFRPDPERPLGRDLLSGGMIYYNKFTCQDCGREFHQDECADDLNRILNEP